MAGNYSPKAGNFTETFAFKRAVVVKNEVRDYTTVFTVKGDIEFVQGREYEDSGRDVSEWDIRIRIYRRSDITTTLKFEHAGTLYDVVKMDPPKQGPRALDMYVYGRKVR